MHLSDVHLGVKPDKEKPWSEKRAQDIWDSFAETIQRAAEEQIDFLLISGDLFHGQPLKKELKEVNYLFEKIPNAKIILMAGNHDYIQQKSYYRTFEWAENVYFFQTEEVTFFDFPEENVAIYGMSYWHRDISERKYDKVVPVNPDRYNILLVHGGDEKHIPFSVKQILNNGFDYMAAGHIHKPEQLLAGQAVMAGSLEPTDCNDVGVHGYWIITAQTNKVKSRINNSNETDVSFYPIKKCEYRHEVLHVTSKDTMRKIQEEIEKLLEEASEYQYFRILIEGYADPDESYDFTRIEQLPRIVDVTEHLVLDYNYEKMMQENPNTLLSSYISRMQSKIEKTSVEDNRNTSDIINKKALEYGVNALLGHKICR